MNTILRRAGSHILAGLLVLLVATTVPGQTPAAKRNLHLEQSLRESLAQSPGIWGVSIKHIERQEFVEIRGEERFQMASVFKVPVLLELLHQVREGKISLEERVEWTDPQRYFGSGILVTLTPGLRPTIRDLATLMMIVSDNAATDILCNRLGFDRINARLRSLGLSKTAVNMGTRDLILQALGLPEEKYREMTVDDLRHFDWAAHETQVRRNQQQFLRECPNCSTPSEMTLLLEKIVTGQALDSVGTQTLLDILFQQQFNQRLPRWIPYGVRFAHKTGTLTAPVWVVNDAGVLFLPNQQRVVLTVFGRGEDLGLSDGERKAAIAAAEDRIAEIGRIVFQFYRGQD